MGEAKVEPVGEAPLSRVRARGKHLWCGDDPHRIHGVTYGSFRRRGDGAGFPEPAAILEDFRAMRRLGIDTVRTYALPPVDLLDAAAEIGLRVFVGLGHHDWRTEAGTDRAARRRVHAAALQAVDEALERLAGRTEVVAVAVGNEVPVDLVRLHGRGQVERTLTAMVDRLHAGDPGMLATYVNFPTTEFLEVPNQDLVAFNVFLEDPATFRRYVEHLQIVSRDRPLVITEIGLAAAIHGETAQADLLDAELRCLDELGAAGGFVFSWTDEWAVADEPVTGWGFGITTEDREPRPVSRVVSEWSTRSHPKGLREEWPRVSVIVCAYNEEATIGPCLDSVLASTYPDLELILCDDGSTDATAEIAAERGVRTLALDHGGLSRARNAGMEASSGEIVAYLDADAACHPDWPFHLALSLEDGVAATGGPNLPYADAGLVERLVAHVPGQACEVLLGPGRAEHVPGCNMAFDRRRLIEIGGFDERYVAAGDDVDVCWKLLDRGYEIGFSPAAQVDHHRRATMRGFLRQQRGYGRSERMLSGPHRHRINAMGQARWRGFVYGPGALLPRLLRPTVYTGWAGEAPFQPVVSHRAASMGAWAAVATPILAVAGLAAVPFALLHPAALLVTALALATLVAIGVGAARGADVPHSEPEPRRVRSGVGFLTVAAPLARTWGRVRSRPLDATPVGADPWTGDRTAWIDDLARILRARGRSVEVGRVGDFWDLETTDGGPVAARLRTAVAWSWEPRIRARYRLRPGWLVAFSALLVVAGVAGAGWFAAAAVGCVLAVLGSFWRTRRDVVAAVAVTTAVVGDGG